MVAHGVSADRQNQLLAAGQALGLDLAEGQARQLLGYLDMLQRWNRVYNLTALRDPAEMLSHHLVDCLAVLPPLQRWWATLPTAAPHRLLDVGSGGGLPGVVLAALQPGWQVDCVDTVVKKVSFIRQVAAELRLPNLQGLHARVESLPIPPGGYPLITSRAFASLADFTALTRHLLSDGGVWMAMKGKLPADEQAALPPEVEVFHVEQLQVPGLDAQRCLVWMRLR
ncbi:MAG: 16S rRNA (guanine(527)-N(7))-methyltransferase RsmG [Aquabacterium sp.]|nr:16S rRNA (guanine(527)-N(7))-methyltransferase RsmG [Aquabacterium sp.]